MRKVKKLLKGAPQGKNSPKGQTRTEARRKALKGQNKVTASTKLLKGEGKGTAATKIHDGKVVVDAATVHYRDFTAPNIPRAAESAPTFSREGSHVLVGRGGGQLSRKFVSSHEAKQALAS